MRFCRAILLIALIGLVIRLGLFFNTVDNTADAYHRAYIGYCWSLHPHLINGEIWTPVPAYAAGILNLLGTDPFYSARAFSLFCAFAFLLSFPFLIAKLFGRPVAIYSTFILTLFPLHAALSVCSLSETPYTLFFFAGMASLLSATNLFNANSRHKIAVLLLSVAFFSLASATRVECWLFAPLWILYFFWNTRNLLASTLLALGLFLFPAYWVTACNIRFDSPFLSFLGPGVNAVYQSGTQTHLGYVQASVVALQKCFLLASPIIPLLALVELLREAKTTLQSCLPERNFSERTLYLIVCLMVLLLNLQACESFGQFVENRFFLNSLIMVIPYSGWIILALQKRFQNNEKLFQTRSVLATLAVASAMMLVFAICKPLHELTKNVYPAVDEMAAWLNSSAVKPCPLFLTTLRWNFMGYRIALLCRKKFKYINIIDNYYSCLPVLKARVSAHKPELLVCTDKDVLELPYAENVVNFELDKEALFSSGSKDLDIISAYHIKDGTLKTVQTIKPVLSNFKTSINVSNESAATNYSDYQW